MKEIIKDCMEKHSKENIERHKTIPQQIKKIKEEIERKNKTNATNN